MLVQEHSGGLLLRRQRWETALEVQPVWEAAAGLQSAPSWATGWLQKVVPAVASPVTAAGRAGLACAAGSGRTCCRADPEIRFGPLWLAAHPAGVRTCCLEAEGSAAGKAEPEGRDMPLAESGGSKQE